MKNVTISLNENEYKKLNGRVEKLNKTRYAVVKKLVKDFLEDKSACLCFLTWPILYALTVAVIILV